MRRMRPLAIALVGVGVLVADVALLFVFEHIPGPVQAKVGVVSEPIRHLVYSASRRRENFRFLGLDERAADRAAALAERHAGERERFGAILRAAAATEGARVCPRDGALPQPYALLPVLVVERNGLRDAPTPDRLFALEVQPWAQPVAFEALYANVERTASRSEDATALALAAVLGGREAELLDGRLAGRRHEELVADDPAVAARLERYVALMHLLVEAGNAPDGICAAK